MVQMAVSSFDFELAVFHHELTSLVNEYHLYPILFAFYGYNSRVDCGPISRVLPHWHKWMVADELLLKTEGLGKVTFPHGPTHVISSDMVWESSTAPLQWHFRLEPGCNPAAYCSVIPEREIHNEKYLSALSASGPPFGLQSRCSASWASTQMLTCAMTQGVKMIVDPVAKRASFYYRDRECWEERDVHYDLTSDMFPLRLGVCGHDGVSIRFLPF